MKKTWSNPAVEELSISKTFGGIVNWDKIDHEDWNVTIAKEEMYSYYGEASVVDVAS